MADRTAFFYGTLMAPGVLYRVIYGTADPEDWQKKLVKVQPAILLGYRRHRVKYADYPAIHPHEGSSVRGSYVTGLTEGDIYRLDIFEGSMYRRDKVDVKLLDDALDLDQKVDEARLGEDIRGEAQTETYIWQDPVEDLEPEEWDFAEFKRAKMMAWMGLTTQEGVEVDDGFEDVDRAVAEQEQQGTVIGTKHDGSGGRVNGHIWKQVEQAGL